MSRMLSVAAILSLIGAVSVDAAFAQSPNCYPDTNRCSSYASGAFSMTNPLQQPPQAAVPLTTGGARAESTSVHVNGSYHSVTNGIPNYDGFDRFRDTNGNPLPGWIQILGNPG